MSRLLSAPYLTRVEAVQKALSDRGLRCLLVSSRENVRYLVGFAGSSGWVLVSDTEVVLATDARYIEQVRRDLGDQCTMLAHAGLFASVATYVATCGTSVLGFEGDHLSYAGVNALRSAIDSAGIRCELRATEGLVESLRVQKDAGEIAAMQQAAYLADGAIAHARAIVKSGMTELELAWEAERWLREHGSGPVPFGIIVASGPNAALPHASPCDRPFAAGEPIVIDLGATWSGYCSDITRTLFIEHMLPPFDSVYRTVLRAHNAALRNTRAGMSGADADELARAVIRDGGLADSFTHGLGHGVGLEVHEKPAIGSRSSDTILNGMVFTIEPGVYLPGQGGVRIEDTVAVRNDRLQSFATSDKEDPIVRVPSGPLRA